jgi:hypothetical protein
MTVSTTNLATGARVTKPAIYSFSHVSGYRSALTYLYEHANIAMDHVLDKEMDRFMGGYIRTIADYKELGLMEVQEGKLPLPFDAYRFLSYKAASQKVNTSTAFHWSFGVLMFNLMARVHSICTIKLKHIFWEADSLVILIPKHKGDQEGKQAFPRHLYANTECPEICPVLSLAVHLFSRGSRVTSELLFEEHADKRFAEFLKGECTKYADILKQKNVNIDEIG